VIFEHLRSPGYVNKPSWKKIEYCCQQAIEDKIQWVWVDTICIDKSSSAELSEAINSMFTWYHDAKVCYAYLDDIPTDLDRRLVRDTWQDCRWFSRGWTLQELLAPRQMIFYGEGWHRLGTRKELCELISQVSRIQTVALEGSKREMQKFSVAQRMCWASQRQTTRSEDIAYCLLGIFGVNMPLLYGEGGERAFLRLQEEIMRDSDDHTLFAWGKLAEERGHEITAKEVGLLARHPIQFSFCKDVLSFRRWDVSDTFSMTNKGLEIMVPMIAHEEKPNIWTAYLDCYCVGGNERWALALHLKQLSSGGDQFARVSRHTLYIPLSLEQEVGTTQKRAIFIRKEIIKPENAFQETAHRLREFRLLYMQSTHQLSETYGCSKQGSSLDKFFAPPRASYYWIDPQAWVNWHVVCRLTSKSKVPNFIVVLGYDTDTAKPWCVVKRYDPVESLREVWGRVTTGDLDTFGKAFFSDGISLVRVSMRLCTEETGVVEVRVSCCKGPSDRTDALVPPTSLSVADEAGTIIMATLS
jgi:hypothetical protein